MELPEVKLNWYQVRMSDGKDECWTTQEAKSELAACNITNMKWGRPWRAQEAKLTPPFYQVSYAGTTEEEAALAQLRKDSLLKANSKILVTPAGEFPSMKAALSQYKTRAKLKTLMQQHPTEYYFKK